MYICENIKMSVVKARYDENLDGIEQGIQNQMLVKDNMEVFVKGFSNYS